MGGGAEASLSPALMICRPHARLVCHVRSFGFTEDGTPRRMGFQNDDGPLELYYLRADGTLLLFTAPEGEMLWMNVRSGGFVTMTVRAVRTREHSTCTCTDGPTTAPTCS